MGLKNFAISIIKSLIVFLIATLVFSTITFNLPNLVKGVFGDIFEYGSPDAQKQAVSNLAETCSSLDKEDVVTMNQICTNRSLLDSMRENCENYRELKRRNIKIENEAQVEETCQQIESGKLESACNEIEGKSPILPDFSNMGALCKDYKEGKINDKEFFFNVIGSALPAQQLQTPNIGVLERYNKAVNYLNNNKLLYFVILGVLLILLYLLIMDVNLFIATLMQISLSIGIIIMLPYFAILAYDRFVGIDTSPILGNMFGFGGIFDFKAIISLVLLMFLRTYNSLIITLGIVFLVVGVVGRFYGFVLKKTIKKKEEEIKKVPKQKKKAKKS